MERELIFQGKYMKFAPTRILCLQAHGPLDADEPSDAGILDLLANGYSVFVQLEPGDGTRYGLMLTGGAYGDNRVYATRVGSPGEGSVEVQLEQGQWLVPDDCIPLAPGNEWSRVFFAWWLNQLRGH